MPRGAKLLIEMVPLSAAVEAEPVSLKEDTGHPKMDFLLGLLIGCLVAGLLVATAGSVGNVLAGAF